MANLDRLLDIGARAGRQSGRHRRPSRLAWPRFVERALGGWAPTLRMATVLVLVLAAGLTCLLLAWGPLGAACVVLLCALLLRIIRLDSRIAA